MIDTVTSDEAFISVTGETYNECREREGFLCDYPEMWFWSHVYTVVAGVKMTVYFHYDNDGHLYRVLLTAAEDRSAAFLDTLVRDEAQLAADVITRLRGEPTHTRTLSILDMEPGYIKYSHMWPANEAGVVHAVGIGEQRSTFYAALDMWWEPLAEAVRRDDGAALEELIDEAADDF